MRLPSVQDWWRRLTRNRVSPLDVAIGLFLSVYAVLLVTGAFDVNGPPRLIPALAVLTMTLPVVWRRRGRSRWRWSSAAVPSSTAW
jgi:hypothetical protein